MSRKKILLGLFSILSSLTLSGCITTFTGAMLALAIESEIKKHRDAQPTKYEQIINKYNNIRLAINNNRNTQIEDIAEGNVKQKEFPNIEYPKNAYRISVDNWYVKDSRKTLACIYSKDFKLLSIRLVVFGFPNNKTREIYLDDRYSNTDLRIKKLFKSNLLSSEDDLYKKQKFFTMTVSEYSLTKNFFYFQDEDGIEGYIYLTPNINKQLESRVYLYDNVYFDACPTTR